MTKERIPDQSGHRAHDTGRPPVSGCEHLLKASCILCLLADFLSEKDIQ
jgi:hypothetical protein